MPDSNQSEVVSVNCLYDLLKLAYFTEDQTV